MNLVFSPQAWDDYQHWVQTDRKLVRRINELIKETARSPYEGIGKPEPLRHALAGFWSRRINEEHRMVYRVTSNNHLEIAQLRFHYAK
jgi:toxin YoeB